MNRIACFVVVVAGLVFGGIFSPSWGCGKDRHNDNHPQVMKTGREIVERESHAKPCCPTCSRLGRDCCCCSETLGAGCCGSCGGPVASCHCGCGDPSQSNGAPQGDRTPTRTQDQELIPDGVLIPLSGNSFESVLLLMSRCVGASATDSPIYIQTHSFLC